MAEHLKKEGIPTEKIRLIRNWADGTLISPIGAAENQLRKSWHLKDRFVVGYAGNLGRAHDLGTIVSTMTLLHDQALKAADNDIVRRVSFAFVGGGAQFPILEREIVQRHLSNVQINPYQPQERLSETLGVADVHLVSLSPELEGLIVPSKFYGIAAAGRPILFIGATDGEIARLIDQAVCGFTIEWGDSQTLRDRILQLAQDPHLCAAMGARVRATFEQHWEKSRAIREWAELLRLVSAKKTSSTVPRWPTTADKLCDKRPAQ
jgi:glycosyltransferase involved in cell wall biosynthesis